MPKKILVIEDDQDVAMVIETILRASGYEIVTAGDAASGVDVARDHHPDLITLDIGMPKGGGITVLGHLRSTVYTAKTPVVVITGSGMIDRDEILRQGANAYLQKPFEPQELLKIVAELA